jgi:hypothetical protein
MTPLLSFLYLGGYKVVHVNLLRKVRLSVMALWFLCVGWIVPSSIMNFTSLYMAVGGICSVNSLILLF